MLKSSERSAEPQCMSPCLFPFQCLTAALNTRCFMSWVERPCSTEMAALHLHDSKKVRRRSVGGKKYESAGKAGSVSYLDHAVSKTFLEDLPVVCGLADCRFVLLAVGRGRNGIRPRLHNLRLQLLQLFCHVADLLDGVSGILDVDVRRGFIRASGGNGAGGHT